MLGSKTWIAMFAAVGCAACSAALDWREFVPEGSGLSLAFPCRPDRQARTVLLAGARAPMQLLTCSVDGTTYALGFVDVADPARIAATLAELRASAVANVKGGEPQLVPLQIAGMTPNPQALRLSMAGRLPDGAAVQEHAAFFTRGLRVYQATVIGAQPAPPAVEMFFGRLKFPG